MSQKERVENKNVQLEKADNSAGEAVGEALESTEKVSEIVGESAGENMSDSLTTKGAQKKSDQTGQKSLPVSQTEDFVMPSVSVQRKKVAKVLMRERKNLLAQLNKVEKGKGFSAHKVEKIILNLRRVQQLLAEILVAAKERMDHLYRQYVIGAK